MIKGCILLSRPANVAIVVASVAIGSFLCGELLSKAVLLASISAALILAGGNCLNDVFDLETDRINRPRRPIPSGRVSLKAASVCGWALLAIGTGLSPAIGGGALAIAASASVFLVLYGLWLKRVVLIGNLLVSALGALAFLFGGVAAGNPKDAWFPAAFAFLFHLGREVVKDAEDASGDRQSGVRTLPVVFGERAGFFFAAGVFAVLVGVTILPFAQQRYGYFYLALVVVGVDLLVGVTMLGLVFGKAWMSLAKASNLLKVGMVCGLAALAVSRA